MPYRILGVHDDYFQKTDPEATSRQKTIYRHLAVMLLVLALLSGVSFGVYGLAVFHSWVVAVFLGITMTAIVFNVKVQVERSRQQHFTQQLFMPGVSMTEFVSGINTQYPA